MRIDFIPHFSQVFNGLSDFRDKRTLIESKNFNPKSKVQNPKSNYG
jgi:hypothetical protein